MNKAEKIIIKDHDISMLAKAAKLISFEGIDERKGTERRVRILYAMGMENDLSFRDLEEITGSPAAALSLEFGRLEENGVIIANRGFVDKTRRTTYRLTDKGRHIVQGYFDKLESCINLYKSRESLDYDENGE